ncbi:threonine synthase [Kiritimatiellota bacterium B12222]|nr:threonine synthase [Kiritimatiellota bacterium B12222]
MNYLSTRGKTDPMSFMDAGLTGLAPDGGLLIPESLPDLSGDLDRLATLSYADLAFEVFSHFATDIPSEDLRGLVDRAYSTFRHPDTAPVVQVEDRYILELFHGPTLAFKDMAMQFLSQFFEYALEKRDQHLNILGSTSGDTGSAAIHGVRGKSRINIFMMHPKGRTSPVQALQMTSVLDANVYNLEIDGTFDDCQAIMKALFADVPFKEQYLLGAVNSVNWVRVMAQIVYYLYSGLKVMKDTGADQVQFSVPTGNFGNILAGYYAMKMGLPVSRFMLATNENDILARFFNTGIYESGSVAKTISPSMDIQVASNFERYLFALLDGDAARVREVMDTFAATGRVDLSDRLKHEAMKLFASASADTAKTLKAIKETNARADYLMDPHTAVGVVVGDELRNGDPLICLSTAHPAKFTDAIVDAIGEEPHHPVLDALKGAETRCEKLPADQEAVRDYLVQKLGG